MTISLGTALLSFTSLFIFLKNSYSYKKLFLSFFTFMLFVKLSINVGYFIKIGNYEILYDEILTIIVAALAIIGMFRYKIDLKIMKYFSLFLVSIGISLISNLILKYDIIGIPYGGSWDDFFYGRANLQNLIPSLTSFLMFARLIMFLVSFIIFCKLVTEDYYKKLYNLTYKLAIFLIFICLIEFIFKNIFKSAVLNDFYLKIFGDSLSTKKGLGVNVAGIYATIGLCREQSTLSANLIFIAIYLLFAYKRTNNKKFIFASIALVCLSIMSMAFSSILYFVLYALLVIYLFGNSKRFRKYFIILLMIFVVVLIMLVNNREYSERIVNSLNIIFKFNADIKYKPLSENIRLFSMMYNFVLFMKYPLVGVGLGVSYCHSGTASVFVAIGLIGVVLYLLLINTILNRTLKIQFDWKIIFIVWLLCCFIGGIDMLYSEKYVLIYLFSAKKHELKHFKFSEMQFSKIKQNN